MTFLYCTALFQSDLGENSLKIISKKLNLSPTQLQAQLISDLETEFNIIKQYIKNLTLKSNCLFHDYCNHFYYLFDRKLEILNKFHYNNPARGVLFRKLTIELDKFNEFLRKFNQYK